MDDVLKDVFNFKVHSKVSVTDFRKGLKAAKIKFSKSGQRGKFVAISKSDKEKVGKIHSAMIKEATGKDKSQAFDAEKAKKNIEKDKK